MSPPSPSEFDPLARALAALLAGWWRQHVGEAERRSPGQTLRIGSDVR